ncbi:MAG: helix-turn-helix domain-containing protein [Chloroflexota bacterium]
MVKLTRLKAVRELKALSQQELADHAGLSRVAVTRIENGDSEPHPRTVRKLAAVLGVEPSALMSADISA